MKNIPDKSIDMIFSDLPYGVTAKNKWDSIIPFEPMWEQMKRIIKDNGIILLFGQNLFSAKLILSNEKMYKYTIIWKKTTPTNFLNANRMPMRVHEDIMVFYKSQPTYNPQKTTGHVRKVSKAEHKRNSIVTEDYNEHGLTTYDSTERFPTDIWEFSTDKQKSAIHPTQKPIDLCRYAIKTYSNIGDTVLDITCGSGTIPLAAKLEGRNYIGFDNGVCEREEMYGKPWADIARERIEKELDQ